MPADKSDHSPRHHQQEPTAMPDPIDGLRSSERLGSKVRPGAFGAAVGEPRPLIYAWWDGRDLPVSWPPHRPEPEPGVIVRLNVDGGRLWRSFRVVGRHDQHAAGGITRVAINLEVEPAPDAD